MKKLIWFSAFLLVGCASIPPAVDSGNSSFEIRYFNGVNSSLKVVVKSISSEGSGQIFYTAESRVPFSGNSVHVKAGKYLVTYQCIIDTTQVAALKFQGIATPEFSDIYPVAPGESLKLSYEMQNNLKYNNFCKPVYFGS